MSINKQFLKSKPVCKVTFKISAESAAGAESATLVGDFNEWSNNATPMRKLKDGSFSIILDLESEKEYQFRYLLDGSRWENEPEADRFQPTPFGDSENAVIEL